jgi:hypothetical protein
MAAIDRRRNPQSDERTEDDKWRLRQGQPAQPQPRQAEPRNPADPNEGRPERIEARRNSGSGAGLNRSVDEPKAQRERPGGTAQANAGRRGHPSRTGTGRPGDRDRFADESD